MSKLQSEKAIDMKTRKNELDVDFIGGAGPLTKEEEKRISEVIRALKAKRLSSHRSTKRKVTKKKETV